MNSHFAIVLTKLKILQWKKRVYIENIFSDGDTKYISTIFGKEYRLMKTSILFPDSCYLDIYVNDKFKYRFNNVKGLFNFLEKQEEIKLWVPKNISDNPGCWIFKKEALQIIRKIKLEDINENNRKSKRWTARY